MRKLTCTSAFLAARSTEMTAASAFQYDSVTKLSLARSFGRFLLTIAVLLGLNTLQSSAQGVETGRETGRGEVDFTALAAYLRTHPDTSIVHELDDDDNEDRPAHMAGFDPTRVRTRATPSGGGHSAYLPTTFLPISPSPADTFQSAIDNNTSIPPDTHGAVDSNYCVTTTNQAVKIQTKSGGAVSSVSLNSFFSPVVAGGVFDPRVHYDPYTHRWIIVAVCGAQSTTSSIVIAVSKTSNPTGAWWEYIVLAYGGGDHWLDFPDVGYNSKWIAISGNLFPNSTGSYAGCKMFMFNKANLLSGGTASFTAFTQTSSFTICPALTYDATEPSMFALETYGDDGTNSYLQLWKITGSVGSETMTSVSFPASAPFQYNPYAFSGTGGPDFGPQVGTTNKVQNNDGRIDQVTFINGKLWAAHSVFLPYSTSVNATRSSIQWWQMDTTGTPIQIGRIDDPTGANFYAFPTMAVNTTDDALIGFAAMSAAIHPSAAYALRLHSDPVDSMRPSQVYRHGQNTYYKIFSGTKNRWGDYSAATVDIPNMSDFYTIQESVTTTANIYDTWWAHVLLPSTCTTPASITGTMSVCVGSTTTLADATSGGTWSSSATGVATVNSSGVVSGVSAGTTTITYSTGAGCNATAIVTVNPLPAAIAGSTSVCAGSTVTLTDATGGGAWTSGTTSVATITSGGVVSGVASGTSTITYTLSTGCKVTALITVNPLPAAITGVTSVCVGLTTSLTDAASGGAWTSGNTSVATITSGGVVTGVAAGTSAVSYTLGSGCRVSVVITVNPLPAVISGSSAVCVGSTITLTDATSGGTWISSSTAIATAGSTTGVVGGVSAGSTSVYYVLTSTGCARFTTFTVNPLPVAITGTTTLCAGSTSTLSDATSGGVWSSSSTSVATVTSGGMVTGVAAGTAVISYTLPTGCFTTALVTVGSSPAAITGTLTACVGSSTTLSDATSGGTWSSSNTSVATVGSGSGAVSGVATGTAIITYSLGGSCRATAVVTVIASPAAITGTTSFCVGSTSTLSDATSGGSWSSSNSAVASISSGGVVTGVSAGTAIITYALSGGCRSTATITIISTAPITGPSTVCLGSAITLSDASSGGVWSSSNTSVATAGSSTGVITGVAAGTTMITYFVPATGCRATAMITVTAAPAPIIGSSLVCVFTSITLVDGTSGGVWTTSDASIASIGTGSGVVFGVSAGTVTITYSLGAGCSTTKVITVGAAGTMTFSYTGSVQTYTVPAGVTSIDVNVQGAAGGLNSDEVTWYSRNGYGGKVEGTLAVTPGQVLNIYVGGQGGVGTPSGTTGGFNGGALAYNGFGVYGGGGGGGASDIRIGGTALADRVIVAGGGGGAGLDCRTPDLNRGGDGGGLTGEDGFAGCETSTAGGGSPTAGGVGGTYTGWTSGNAGSLGIGGDAGTGTAGGGGAGGYYGGGGGSWSGGGGGSSYTDATLVSSVTHTRGYNSTGDGIVTISIPCVTPPAPGAIAGGTSVCTGTTLSLMDTVTGGSWTSSNVSVATIDTFSGVLSGVTPGTTTVTYTLPGGISTTVITVNPTPYLITGLLGGAPSTVCAGSVVYYSDGLSGGRWSTSDMTIATADTTGGTITGVTGILGGTVDISYIMPTGCFVTTPLTVLTPLTVAPISGAATLYVSSSAGYFDATSGPASSWASSNTAVVTINPSTGAASAVTVGTAVITYTASLCGPSFTTLTVSVISSTPSLVCPTLTAIYGFGDTSICAGSCVVLTSTDTTNRKSSTNYSVASIAYTPASYSAGTRVTLGDDQYSDTISIPFTFNFYGVNYNKLLIGSNGNVSFDATLAGTVDPWSIAGPLPGSNDAATKNCIMSPKQDQLGGAGVGTFSYATYGSAPCRTFVISYDSITMFSCTSLYTSQQIVLHEGSNAIDVFIRDKPICSGWNGGNAILGVEDASGSNFVTYPGFNGTNWTASNFGCRFTPSAIPAWSFAWTDPGGSVVGSTSTLTVCPTATTLYHIAGYSSSGTDTVTVTDSVLVTVLPAPAAIAGTMSVCVGSTTTLTDATPGGTWRSGSTSVGTINVSTGVFTGVSAGTSIITYTVGCNMVTATVTVNPLPGTAVVSGGGSYCVSTVITATGGSGGTMYFQGTTSGGTSTATPSTSQTITVSGTYYFRAQSAAGCWGPQGSVVVVINPLPATIAGTTTVCVGLTTTLTDATGGGVWTSSNPAVASVGFATGTALGIANGTTTITYALSTGCIATTVLTVVSPSAITGTATVNVGSTTTLSDAAPGGIWSSSNTAIATVGTGSGIVSGVASGTSRITYSLGTGCYATLVVTVNAVAAPITGTTTICAGTITTLSDATPGGVWSSSNTAVASIGTSTGVLVGVSDGTATITYAVGSSVVTVTVTINGAPTITALSVSTGFPTTSVTITGTNFNTTTTNNIVYFGATMATVGSASGTSLGVTVPADATYMPVSVTNTSCNLTAWSQYAFLPTYDNTAYASGVLNLNTKVDFTAGTNPFSVAVGDIDGDGKSDMAVANYGANSVSVYRNTSTSGSITSGSFAAKVDFTTGTSPQCVVIADVDNDGRLDVLVANNGSTTVSVLRNTATSGSITSGSLAAKVDFATGSGPISLAVGDLDMDGKADIAVANYAANTISVLRNTATTGTMSSGSFAAKVDFTAASHPYSIAIGDLDGDGKKDLAVANQGINSVSAFRNTSVIGAITSSSFAAKVDFTTGTSPFSVAIGDIDGDGKMDLAVANNTSNTVSLFRNTSTSGTITTSSFAAKVDFTTGSGAYHVALADLNGDAKLDVVTANSTGNSVSLFRNTATSGTLTSASMAAKVDFTTGSAPRFVALGDLDGDGMADIAVVNISTNNVSILRNNPIGAITGTTTVCGPTATTTLSDITSGGAWSSSNTSVATVNSSGVVTGVASGTATISYTVAGGSATVVVTVGSSASITGTASVCVGSTTLLSNATSGGVWSSGSTSVATIDGAGLVTGVSAGTTVISYAVSGCTAMRTVTVNPLPASISGSTSVCIGSVITLTDASGGGTWTSSNTSVATAGSATGVITGVSAGTTTITYRLATGCYTTVDITVNPLPSAITGTAVACVGSSTTLSGVGGGAWTSSNTSVATVGGSTGDVWGVAAGTATITYTLGTGCRTTRVVTINPLPSAITGVTSVCSGSTTILTDVGGGSWISSDAAVATVGTSSGIVSGVSGGTVTISYVLATGCMTTTVVTVNPLPASISGTASVCVGQTTTLSDAGGGVWTSSNTAKATVGTSSGIVTGVAAGSSTISYTLSTGCRTTIVVTVSALPSAITGSTGICTGSTSTLSDATTGGTWSSSDGAIAAIGSTTGVVTGASSGTAIITYTTSAGCMATTVVTVSPLSSITGTASVCAGAVTTLSNATSGGIWSSSSTGVATIGASSGIVSGVSAGTATITYTVGTGCSATIVVSVNPVPSAITGPYSLCVFGSTTLTGTGGGTWTTSNSAVATIGLSSGFLFGVSAGTAVITYTLPTGCSTTATFTVSPTPSAISGTTSACVGATTTLSDAGGGAWSSSNTSVASVGAGTGVVTGVTAGTAVITYTLGTGCLTTVMVTITPTPSAISGAGAICLGSSITLTDVTSGGTWASSNPAVASVNSTTGAVTGTAPGTAVITYSLGSSCVVTASVSVIGAPTITSLSTVSGIPASSVTISGTNFNTTPSSNIVFFGATKATVVTASSTSLGVTVPSGATFMPVSVNNSACALTAYSQQFFLPTFNNSAYVAGTVNFDPYATFAGGFGPHDVTIVDIDGDGLSDLVTANSYDSSISIYRNTSTSGVLNTGSFAAKVDFRTMPNAYSVAAGDLDGDGKPDLAIAAGGGLSIFRNTATSGSISSSSLGTRADLTGSSVFVVAIADMDADGRADLVTGNFVAVTGASIYKNVSSVGSLISSSFAAPVDYVVTTSFPYSPSDIAVGDLDGDGKPDVVISNSANNSVEIFKNNATPGLITSSSLDPNFDQLVGTGAAFSVVMGDMDGDGVNDLVVGNAGISVMRNVSPPGFLGPGSFAITDFATGQMLSLAIGDMDGDGKPDVTGVDYAVNSVYIVRNTSTSGSVSMAPKATYPTGDIPYAVAVGDLDGDGMADIAMANWGANTVSVMRNNPLLPISGTTTACASGGTTTLTDATAGGVWSSSNTSVATVGTGSGLVTGVSAGTAVISYTVAGGSATRTVTIISTPAITGTASVCTGATTTLSSSGGGTWTSGNTSVATVSSSTGVVTGVTSGTSIITYALGSGCASTIVVTVNPLPSAITGPYSLCVFASTTLTGTGGGTWTTSNSAVATIGLSSGFLFGSSAGTAIITYTLPTGCRTTATFTVSPTPAAISGSSSVCEGATITLSDATGGGTWSSSNTATATIGSGSGVVTGVLAGTTTITYTIGTGCITTLVVNVNTAPAAISGASSVCLGSTITLTDATPGGVWTSTNTAAATIGTSSGIVTGVAAPATTTISYTVAGCAATTVITVNTIPSAITGTTTMCSGSTVTLSDATGGGTWSSSNTSVATAGSSTGVITGVAGGTSVITYSTGTGCIATTVVTVNPGPVSITGTTSICGSSTTTLSDATAGGTWSSSNTAVASVNSTSGVVAGISNGTAVITYATTCGSTTTTVTVGGAPVITSLSTQMDTVLASVTITGITFNTTPTSNIVYFGATKASVTSASGTSLTVTVPVGSTFAPVSVENTGCLLTAYSQYPFLPSYNNSAYINTTIVFSAKVDFTTGTNPFNIALGDIDGDGKADMVATNYSSNTISVFRNTSTSGTITSGSFAAKVDFTTGLSPYGVTVGDLDGDGKLDIVVTNNTSSPPTVSVYRNTATSGSITSGSLAAKVDFGVGAGPIGAAIVDVDKDGKPEIVVANNGANTISVLRNTSTSGAITSGSFGTKVDFTSGSHPYGVVFGDIDGDGKPDMVVPNQAAANVSVFRNTATTGAITSGSFAAKVDFTCGSQPFNANVADIDGDGKMDVITANNAGNSVSVLRNTATSGSITSGSLAAKVDFTTGSGPYCVAVGDINGDGKADLVTANSTGNTVSVLRNTATSGTITSGSFAAKTDFTTGAAPRYVAVGDLDGDSKPDIATSNISGNTVSVLRNNPTLHPTPGIGVTAGTVSLCVGSSVSVADGSSEGSYTTANSKVAIVNEATGVVTGMSAGRTTVGHFVAGNLITTTVIVTPLPEAVYIAATPGTNVQRGQNVKLVAAVQNGGTNPVYQWLLNGVIIPGAVNFTYSSSDFADNDVVTCKVGGAGCGDFTVSNSVTLHVQAPGDNSVILAGTDIRLNPNPNTGTFTINGNLPVTVDQEVTVEVMDMLGQVIYKDNVVAKAGKISEQIKLGGSLANGMYMLTLRSGNENKMFHFAISR